MWGVRGIKNADKILEMKKKRYIREVILAATSRGFRPPFVNFDGELCAGYDGNEWAHYHPDRHVICVPLHMLRRMDEFKLKTNAIHEVSHIFDHTHGTSFYQEMQVTTVSSWLLELPRGVSFTYEGMYKSEIKHDRRKDRVDKTRCNYHACRGRRKSITPCPHCDGYYCHQHIEAYTPGKANPESRNMDERYRALERTLLEYDGHACGEYIDYTKREKERRTAAVLKFLNHGRVEYLVPHDITCAYKSCNVKLKDERGGHLCRSCNMTFCKKHKNLEDHECCILDLIGGLPDDKPKLINYKGRFYTPEEFKKIKEGEPNYEYLDNAIILIPVLLILLYILGIIKI